MGHAHTTRQSLRKPPQPVGLPICRAEAGAGGRGCPGGTIVTDRPTDRSDGQAGVSMRRDMRQFLLARFINLTETHASAERVLRQHGNCANLATSQSAAKRPDQLLSRRGLAWDRCRFALRWTRGGTMTSATQAGSSRICGFREYCTIVGESY